MPDGFEVNTEALARPVSGIEDVSTRLGRVLSNLQENLNNLGEPWGGDETGKQFLQQYHPARDQVTQGTSSTVGSVHGVAKGISSMKNGFDKTEQNAADNSSRLLPPTVGDTPSAPRARR